MGRGEGKENGKGIERMGREKGERRKERELERERGDGEGLCGGEEEGRAN